MSSELIAKIKKYREQLGDSVVIPAHHYQREDVVAIADFTGDSYKLAVDAAACDAEFILFCGVRFMAEGASVLSKEYQKIVVPELLAGCPMADMIDKGAAEKAYGIISAATNKKIAPVVYMNSYVDVKSFCGEHSGAVCTSSNAKMICKSYLDNNQAIFFFPDYNLGINTADELGLADHEVARIGHDMQLEPKESYDNVKIFLWDGFCHVHKVFTTFDIKELREEYQDISIIVHPECNRDVVQDADFSGSTAQILNTIRDAAPGTVWGVGTELNFVERIAHDFGPGTSHNKRVIPLRKSACTNMEKSSLEKVARSLESIIAFKEGRGDLDKEIVARKEYQESAKRSLNAMIDIVQKNSEM